jgi:hypothetical protein
VIVEIWREEYLTARFWKNYEIILPLLWDETETCVKFKDGSVLCCGFRDSWFRWFDATGKLENRFEDFTREFEIESFDVDAKGDIWYTMPLLNKIYQFSLESNQNIFCLDSWLNLPEEIKIYDNVAYICNVGSCRILSLDINTRVLQEYMRFDEPVWQYIRIQNREYFRLDSWLYFLE